MSSGDMLKRRYKLVRLIGSGTFASVYLAQDLTSQEYYAVKIIERKWFQDESMLERFSREVELGMQLQHNHIIKVLSYGRTEQGYYIVMEWIQGITLRQYMQKKGVMSLNESLTITNQVLSALAYAYHHGVSVHRDIKPENIMIEAKTGRVVVLDFGIAQIQGSYVTKHSRLFSLRYAAPEQLSEKTTRINQSADLYAVGVILYEMLTGRVPFKGRSMVELYELQNKRKFIPPHLLNESLSKEWQKFFERALHPGQRYKTPTLMIEGLQPFVSLLPARSKKNSSKSVVFWFFLSFFVILFLVLFVGLYLRQFNNNLNFDKVLNDLNLKLEEKAYQVRHRMSITSPIPIQIQLFNPASKEVTHQMQIDQAHHGNQYSFDILKSKESSFDFFDNAEVVVKIQDLKNLFEPIHITAFMRKTSEEDFYWDFKEITVGKEIMNLYTLFDQKSKKIILLHEGSPVWKPITLLKFDVKEAEKITLFEKSAFFEAQLHSPGFQSYLAKNEENNSIFLAATPENPVIVNCRIKYSADEIYDLPLRYNGELASEENRWILHERYLKNVTSQDKMNHFFLQDGSIRIKLKVYDEKNYPTLTLTKIPKGKMIIYVLDKEKRGISNASVLIHNLQQSEKKDIQLITDEEGRLTIQMLYGEYAYTVKYGEKNIFNGNFIIESLEAVTNIETDLELGYIEFNLVDSERSFILDAKISIFDENLRPVKEIKTNDRGEVNVILPYGKYTFSIKSKEYKQKTIRIEIDSPLWEDTIPLEKLSSYYQIGGIAI